MEVRRLTYLKTGWLAGGAYFKAPPVPGAWSLVDVKRPPGMAPRVSAYKGTRAAADMAEHTQLS